MSEHRYRLNSNTGLCSYHPRNKTYHKIGFPRAKVNSFEGNRLSRKQQSCMSDKGRKEGGNFRLIDNRIRKLISKFVNKPFDSLLKAVNARLKGATKTILMLEFGLGSPERYLKKYHFRKEKYQYIPKTDDYYIDENGIVKRCEQYPLIKNGTFENPELIRREKGRLYNKKWQAEKKLRYFDEHFWEIVPYDEKAAANNPYWGYDTHNKLMKEKRAELKIDELANKIAELDERWHEATTKLHKYYDE